MVDPEESSEKPDWRRSETYEYTRALPRRGWAWEFLRRNPDYQREPPPLPDRMLQPRLTVFTLRRERSAEARWGLLFRRPPAQERGRSYRFLASGPLFPSSSFSRAARRFAAGQGSV